MPDRARVPEPITKNRCNRPDRIRGAQVICRKETHPMGTEVVSVNKLMKEMNEARIWDIV